MCEYDIPKMHQGIEAGICQTGRKILKKGEKRDHKHACFFNVTFSRKIKLMGKNFLHVFQR